MVILLNKFNDNCQNTLVNNILDHMGLPFQKQLAHKDDSSMFTDSNSQLNLKFTCLGLSKEPYNRRAGSN